MRGIGDKLDKQTKIKILQQRAHQYNDEFDELEEKGHNPDQIREMLKTKEYSMRHTDDKDRVLPFDESRHVIKVSGGTDYGFEQSHKTLSATKQMYEPAKKNYEKKKELQKKGLKDPEDDIAKKYKEQDKQMIKKIYEDHIQELMSGEGYKKDPSKSNYQENYEFNNDFQKECDTQDFAHHQMKNDLKWYSEATVKYKLTLRK